MWANVLSATFIFLVLTVVQYGITVALRTLPPEHAFVRAAFVFQVLIRTLFLYILAGMLLYEQRDGATFSVFLGWVRIFVYVELVALQFWSLLLYWRSTRRQSILESPTALPANVQDMQEPLQNMSTVIHFPATTQMRALESV